MKKALSLLLAIMMLCTFSVFALGSTESDDSEDQGKGTAAGATQDGNLGDYKIEIVSCRIDRNLLDEDIVIIKYAFTNNGDDPASFAGALETNVYQNDIGLNETIFGDDNYESDAQLKEIKKGATLELEIAYKLDDKTTDVEVEVKEFFSFSDKVITKSFSIK